MSLGRSGRRRVVVAAMVLAVLATAIGWIVARREIVDYRASLRLGDSGGMPTNFPGTTTRVILAHSARAVFEPSGVADFSDWSMDVAIDPAAQFLSFSIGVRDAAAGRGDLRFTISVVERGKSAGVFDELLEGTTPGWHDRLIPIPALETEQPILRFAVRPAADAAPGHPLGAGVWGSVRTVAAKRGLAALGERWRRDERGKLPNVVLVSLDTLGAEHLSSFGGRPNLSPNIDALLSQGANFRRAYAPYPNTLVSHATLLTGLHPKHHGVYDETPFLQRESLAQMLAAKGYLTLAITEDGYIASGFGFDRGFDRYDDGPAPAVDQFVGDATLTFSKAIEAVKGVPREIPIFLFVHTYEVHTPYRVRDEEARKVGAAMTPGYTGPYQDLFDGALKMFAINAGSAVMPPADVARLEALYTGEIDYLDRAFGRFLGWLTMLRPRQDTVIIVTSDHGEEFMRHGKLGHGETLHADVMHVPLGFSWPGKIVEVARDEPVGLVDVVPTVLELVGATPPASLDGRSLVSSMLGTAKARPSAPVFSELRTSWGDCRKSNLTPPCRVSRIAVRTDHFTFMSSRIPKSEVLYDVRDDPEETRDVAARFPAEAEGHRALVTQYRAGEADGDGAREEIDDETRSRLRALGYLR